MPNLLKHVCQMDMPWPLWVLLLCMTNAASVFFLDTPEGKVTLAVFGLVAVAAVVIHPRVDSIRRLGAAQLPWVFLVPWLFARRYTHEPFDAQGIWLNLLVVVDGLALFLASIDLVWGLLGDRSSPR